MHFHACVCRLNSKGDQSDVNLPGGGFLALVRGGGASAVAFLPKVSGRVKISSAFPPCPCLTAATAASTLVPFAALFLRPIAATTSWSRHMVFAEQFRTAPFHCHTFCLFLNGSALQKLFIRSRRGEIPTFQN